MIVRRVESGDELRHKSNYRCFVIILVRSVLIVIVIGHVS